MKTWYTEKQVKKLLEQQRYICQQEFDKDSMFDENDKCFVSCDDVLNAKEPELPKGKKGEVYSDKQMQRIHQGYDEYIGSMLFDIESIMDD